MGAKTLMWDKDSKRERENTSNLSNFHLLTIFNEFLRKIVFIICGHFWLFFPSYFSPNLRPCFLQTRDASRGKCQQVDASVDTDKLRLDILPSSDMLTRSNILTTSDMLPTLDMSKNESLANDSGCGSSICSGGESTGDLLELYQDFRVSPRSQKLVKSGFKNWLWPVIKNCLWSVSKLLLMSKLKY